MPGLRLGAPSWIDHPWGGMEEIERLSHVARQTLNLVMEARGMPPSDYNVQTFVQCYENKGSGSLLIQDLHALCKSWGLLWLSCTRAGRGRRRLLPPRRILGGT